MLRSQLHEARINQNPIRTFNQRLQPCQFKLHGHAVFSLPGRAFCSLKARGAALLWAKAVDIRVAWLTGGDGSVSPTKAGTKLAHLKRRQQEARRAMSAGGTPGFLTPVSSWSPAGESYVIFICLAVFELASSCRHNTVRIFDNTPCALKITIGLHTSSGRSSAMSSPAQGLSCSTACWDQPYPLVHH